MLLSIEKNFKKNFLKFIRNMNKFHRICKKNAYYDVRDDLRK